MLLDIAVALLPINRDLVRAAAAEDCTSVTLMGVILGFFPEVLCCMTLWTPLLLLVSKLVPACMIGAAGVAGEMCAPELLLWTALECL